MSYGFKKIHPVWFVLAQFHPRNRTSQHPFYNIDYSGSHRPFLFLCVRNATISAKCTYGTTVTITVFGFYAPNSF